MKLKICHQLPGHGLTTCGAAGLMLDVTQLLTDYDHVVYGDCVADTEEELDMVLRSKGVDVVYGAEPRHDIMLSYYQDRGLSIRKYNTDGTICLANFRRLPVFANYAKGRATLVTRKGGVNVGVMGGLRTFSPCHADDMAKYMPEDWHLFYTRFPHDHAIDAMDNIGERLLKGKATPCAYKTGTIHKHLALLDVLWAPRMPDRLMWEAKASGVPVLTENTAKEAIATIDSLHKDRKKFRSARLAAIEEASHNDLAYEIVHLKERLKQVQIWSTSG